ncbi:hypothetical protein HRG_001823 [Hirsutella rhossiliensis]|uniref:Uncharacterized protein n=1 Tax=Hirsutella rhossiliensis TaxID=111463 RepID=A0A9P8N409_9HYPO|nr:uncharacterized protein HRG_01823 [Hirsutella rhossiliensis]KAH0966414.1 hypothetical protein HRG_01823 [Hirsutella rhossiliensis]
MPQVGPTTARLRRTFHYPDDSDSDSQPDAIDEQEQEDVIARLAAENTARNARFRRLLVALPLLAALPYLPLLVRPRVSLLALLALTSLSATAYLLHRLPPHLTGIAPLDAWTRVAPSRDARAALRPRPPLPTAHGSPLETYLPYLNAGLAAVLVLMGMLTGRGTGSFGWVGVGNLPAIVYSVVLAAKIVMASVDPERELSALKYDYKGA